MISRDADGFILDNSLDGGDSANRAGILALCGSPEVLSRYVKDGVCVRHPTQHPWDNPKNFTRDQLTPLVAGLWAQGQHAEVRKILWRHILRLGFAQNFERDIPGSTKYPWPHSFINDKGQYEKRNFDFADPLGPSDFWHLILCARAWYFYWLAPLGYAWLLVSLVIYCLCNNGDDEGQVICQCAVAGKPFKKLYLKLRKNAAAKLYQYWSVRRNQAEIGRALWGKLND